jgi:TRAP-type mannitol/chloroaromatic compound transport system permease small subunit
MSDENGITIENEGPGEASIVTRILRGIVKVITKINEGVGKFCSFTLLLLLFLMIVEVFRRYVLKSPSIWGFDLSLWLFGMPALLAGGWVLSEHGHVNMDMLYNKFSPRGKAILDCITSIAFFTFIIVMMIQCWKGAMLAISRGEMSITNWQIKIWPVKIWMPVAAGLTLIQGAAEFIKNLYKAITGRSLIK